MLRSPATLQILADALGRDLEVSRESEASLCDAAVYALEKLGHTTGPPTRIRRVRHDPATSTSHRERQSRQAAMEAGTQLNSAVP